MRGMRAGSSGSGGIEPDPRCGASGLRRDADGFRRQHVPSARMEGLLRPTGNRSGREPPRPAGRRRSWGNAGGEEQKVGFLSSDRLRPVTRPGGGPVIPPCGYRNRYLKDSRWRRPTDTGTVTEIHLVGQGSAPQEDSSKETSRFQSIFAGGVRGRVDATRKPWREIPPRSRRGCRGFPPAPSCCRPLRRRQRTKFSCLRLW